MIAGVLCVACWLLAARVLAAPPSATTPANINEITSQSTLLHTANHEVTRLGVLFGEDQSIENKVVLFIESEINKEGERVDYGLYALTNDPKNSNITIVTKLLDNARDIAMIFLKSDAYFAAKDGLYVYNKEKNSAEKYGTVNEEVVSIAVENATGTLYYVNKNHQLYKVTEGGQKSSIVDAVKNVEQISIDIKGHLYYYTVDKRFYVYNGHNITPVEGIPSNLKSVQLDRSPVLVEDYGFVNGGDDYYVICGTNATARLVSTGRWALDASAVSPDAGIVLYYAIDKKIYEFNIIEKIAEGLMHALSSGLKRALETLRNSFN